MIINHNLGAMNAQRNMGINSGAASKSMEKLSSGLKINRAGDDAAGLSISEKMRAQIRGLDKASTNAEDGISLIQTAEGALNETHSILQRMRELSVQASNDTNTTDDRDAIQKEITQLTSEIDRIATTTEFNTKNLLDGSFSGSLQIGANSGQNMDISIGTMTSNGLGLTGGAKLNTVAGVAKDKLTEGDYTINGTKVTDAKGNEVGKIDVSNGKITLADGATTIALGHAITDGSTVSINKDGDSTVTLAKGVANTTNNLGKLAAGDYTVSGTNLLLGDKLVGTLTGNKANALKLTDGTTVDLTAAGLVDADVADGKTFTIKGIDVSTGTNASGSLDTIDSAIKNVSSQRSSLGAIQNRLEHTINNLGTASENLTAAESRIRDTDMASEMSEYSKNNILQQAAQAMLAQAKSAPEQVLQLLR